MRIRRWMVAIALAFCFCLLESLLFSQDKVEVTEAPSFPINFSCGLTPLNDNQGKQNGWLMVTDIVSRQDDVDVKTTHVQTQYRMGDEDKSDKECLRVHKIFNAERAADRNRLKKAKPFVSHPYNPNKIPTKDHADTKASL